jgi:hypothetical protein
MEDSTLPLRGVIETESSDLSWESAINSVDTHPEEIKNKKIRKCWEEIIDIRRPLLDHHRFSDRPSYICRVAKIIIILDRILLSIITGK